MMRPEAKAILNKYYVVSKITVEEKGEAIKLENPGAAELFANYYANTDTTPPIKKNVPCLIFLNVGKNKIAQYTGFPEGKEGFNNFENCLKQTSGISQNEIGVLRKVFMDIYVRVTPPAASEILNAAFAQATAENKKVFLVFHASWCHWCHVLDTAMNDPACKSFFTKNYIICHLTVSEAYNLMLNENPGAAKLISNYQDQAGLGKFQRGIPLSVVFDKDGNKLGIFNGFPTPFYAGYKDFENLIKNTASVSEKDLETIKEVFDRIGRKNGLKPKK
jgi:thioredoxin-related protein